MLFAAVSYIVSGRVDDSSDWVVISQGDLPWHEGDIPGRNARGNPIDESTYESGDVRRVYTEVLFEDNAVAYLHYKLQFPESRNGGDGLQFSEVELPGFILDPGTTPSPTPPPTSSPFSPVSTTCKDKMVDICCFDVTNISFSFLL